MSDMIKKQFDAPEGSMDPAEKIHVDIVEVAGTKIMRVTAQPGWKWSVDLKPVQKTDSCQMDHLLYMVSGVMVVKMDDGQELTFNVGDIASIPPGHDGWGVGDEPTVWLELAH